MERHMNPPTLNKDVHGNYIITQLEGIIKTYKANLSYLENSRGKRTELLEVIERKETSTRGNYLRLLNKRDKTEEEHEALDSAIQEIERMYVSLPSVERRIRDTERRLQAVYPPDFMEVVNTEYEKLKGDF
jgi:chromosome segregation ATPase